MLVAIIQVTSKKTRSITNEPLYLVMKSKYFEHKINA